jgi:hypothetical protein
MARLIAIIRLVTLGEQDEVSRVHAWFDGLNFEKPFTILQLAS